MSMDLGGSGGGPRSEINVTPLVDVVLVLLIIFMVVQPLLQMGYDVQVPPNNPQPQNPNAPPAQHVVSMNAAREIFLNKEKVEMVNLPIRISELMRNRASKVVFFFVEDSVNYGDAMKVLDVIRGNGAANIGMVMEWVNPMTPTAAAAAPAP